MQKNKIESKPRIKSLDGIKALAMLAMFWWHSSLPNPAVDLGARVCELLFVASGFLVGYNYYGKDKTATWKASIKYVWKKIISFWPLYVIATIVLIASGLSSLSSLRDLENLIINLSLMQAWSNNPEVFFGFNGVAWFLSALMFCYFLTPVLLKCLKSIRLSVVLFAVVFFIRFCIEYSVLNSNLIVISIHVNPVVRSMEFFMGMLMVPFYISMKKWMSIKKTFVLMTLLEIITLVLMTYLLVNKLQWYRACFVVVFCVVVYVFSFGSGLVGRFLSLRCFQLFGMIQLEFYILHQVAIRCLTGIYNGIIQNVYFVNTLLIITIIVVSVIYTKTVKNNASRILSEGGKRIKLILIG